MDIVLRRSNRNLPLLSINGGKDKLITEKDFNEIKYLMIRSRFTKEEELHIKYVYESGEIFVEDYFGEETTNE